LFLECAQVVHFNIASIAGTRLIFFAAHGASFPFADFNDRIRPWIQSGTDADTPVWEGPGCWNPLFPARQDDVALAAATASKLIDVYAKDFPARPQLHVFDQRTKDGALAGFSQVNLENV
jgi:hypothetical protein